MDAGRAKRRANRAAPEFALKFWHVAAGAVVLSLAAHEAYRPALHGPFVFDDQYLPFYSYDFGDKPLRAVVSGVRPLLMLTFWLNYRLSELEPYTYHLFNLLFHVANAVLVFWVVRKALTLAGDGTATVRRELLAAFASAVFLLHPVQTEAVAYVASRSENLSVLFFLAAFALFLYRRHEAISWPAAAGISALYGAAVSTKEHTAVLPALLLATDYSWGGWRTIARNWRLYSLLAVLGAGGLWFVWRVLASAQTAGFGMPDLPWHHYFFTQWRAFWVYVRLFLWPAGQNVDYAYPISRSIFDHGAVLGLAALIAAVGAAFFFRRRYPLAWYGTLVTLILFAPTSSVVPIRDAVAERRLYLPFVGLLFILVEFLRRAKLSRGAVAAGMAGVLLLGILTHRRAQVWGSEVALWEDSVRKSPHNARAHFQLAVAYYVEKRCPEALRHFAEAARLSKPDARLLVDWGLAEDCAGRPAAALEKLREAARLEPNAHVYTQIGMVHGKLGRLEEALQALEQAAALEPNYDLIYYYRGNVHAVAGRLEQAREDYHRALQLNPKNEAARRALLRIGNRLR
ncbi:MAG: tetratricopeptide repeat protein [Bryobacterales bacterium]|nr:tetratricopeptide repeat protein [Bryobacteraceae bacterium]MDW8355412.1 tetratricopeptide repeat protein [Bryobacterales bacterium]